MANINQERIYLIQDSRTYVGNCVLWWGPNRGGYTSSLEEAGLYTKEEAEKQHKDRKTDISRLYSEMRAIAKLTVDMQNINHKI